MKNFFKGKAATAIIVLATFILAGVAIFTAIRLYQLRQQPVAPNVPSSQPKAQNVGGLGELCGGIQGILCQSGLNCIYSNGAPQPPSPDASGTCQAAGEPKQDGTTNSCPLFSFTLAVSSPTASPTESPTSTPTPTPTPTPVPGTPNSCGGTCGSNFNCASDLVCYNNFCRNPSCTASTSCACGGTSTLAPTGTPTASVPSLPQSGTDWPTIAGAGFGILVILGSLLLAL